MSIIFSQLLFLWVGPRAVFWNDAPMVRKICQLLEGNDMTPVIRFTGCRTKKIIRFQYDNFYFSFKNIKFCLTLFLHYTL